MRMIDLFELLRFEPHFTNIKKASEGFGERASVANALLKALQKVGATVRFSENFTTKEKFLWEGKLSVEIDAGLPATPKDYENTKKLREVLRGAVELRAEDFLGAKVRSKKNEIEMEEGVVRIPQFLAERILDQKLKRGDPLTIEDALKVIESLLDRWKDLEGARQKGWIVGSQWIWKAEGFLIHFDEKHELPENLQGISSLRDLVRHLEEIKEKGAGKFLRIWTKKKKEEIDLSGALLLIPAWLAEKYLGKRIRGQRKKLSFEEALETLKDLLREWEDLLEEAEKKGWIKEDLGREFIWNSWHHDCIFFDHAFPSCGSEENLRELKVLLEEIKQKGAERFLEVKVLKKEEQFIEWARKERTIYVSSSLVKEVLGKEAEDGELLPFEDLLRMAEKIWERGRRVFENPKEYMYQKDHMYWSTWIWKRDYGVKLLGKELPDRMYCLEELENVLKALEELKQKGVEEFLLIVATDLPEISWHNSELEIFSKLASEVLGREVKPEERLSFEEAYKTIKWLHERWQKLPEEGEKKGWIYRDGEGRKRFVWEENRWTSAVSPYSELDLERLRHIKGILEAFKEKKVPAFVEAINAPEFIYKIDYYRKPWLGIYRGLAERALGREVKLGEDLDLDEALRIVSYLYKRWKEVMERGAEVKYSKYYGEENFIWSRSITVFFEETEEGFKVWGLYLEAFEEFKRALEEIKKEGLEDFLWIKAGIEKALRWMGRTIIVPLRLLEALGKKVEEEEPLSFEELLEVLELLKC